MEASKNEFILFLTGADEEQDVFVKDSCKKFLTGGLKYPPSSTVDVVDPFKDVNTACEYRVEVTPSLYNKETKECIFVGNPSVAGALGDIFA